MSKNRLAANFILRNGMTKYPSSTILERLKAHYPNIDFQPHDVTNGLYLIDHKGYQLPQDEPPTPQTKVIKRKRKSPLLYGDYADAACYVAKAIERFTLDEKIKFSQVLSDKIGA